MDLQYLKIALNQSGRTRHVSYVYFQLLFDFPQLNQNDYYTVFASSRENNNCRSIAVPVVRSSSWLHHPSHSAPYDWPLSSADYSNNKACGDASMIHHSRHIEPSKVGKSTLHPMSQYM